MLLRSVAERRAFLRRAEELTRAAIDNLKTFLEAERRNAEADYLASVGALYQLEARLKWLRLLSDNVDKFETSEESTTAI